MNNLMNVLKKELREMFRDKKSLSMMLIIPIMIPLLVIGMSALFDSETNKDVTEYNKIGFAYELSEDEIMLAKLLNIDVTTGSSEELVSLFDEGKLDLYVTKEDNKYTLHSDMNEKGSYAGALMESYYEAYKEILQTKYLDDAGIDSKEVIEILKVERDINEAKSFYAEYIVTYTFLFIIMAITVSATYPATDATAGEKERGTLETLLTFPIKSKDIIVGKFLSVTISSIITGLLGLILAQGSLMYANSAFDIYKEATLALSVPTLLFAFVVIISYSLLISGLSIAIASKCKTFKEAQSALTPLTFISFFPSMIAFLVNVKTNVILAMIPFLNYTLLFSDMVDGNVDIINILIMLLSSILVIIIVLGIIIKQYKSEKVLFQN